MFKYTCTYKKKITNKLELTINFVANLSVTKLLVLNNNVFSNKLLIRISYRICASLFFNSSCIP